MAGSREGEPPVARVDIMWFAQESGEFSEFLTESAVMMLSEKGYCVIKTFKDREIQEETTSEVMTECKFENMPEQFAAGYLGLDCTSKVAWVDDAAPPGLSEYDYDLAQVSASLIPVASSFLDSELSERTPGMVRMPLNESEEDTLLPSTLIGDLRGGLTDEYIDFCWRKKLMMIYIVDDAGELLLGVDEVKVECSPSKLILMRGDMNYSWRPSSKQSMIIQCWLLAQPTDETSEHIGEQLQVDTLIPPDPALQTPTGPRTNVISMKCRVPGRVNGGLGEFLHMTLAACDCAVNHELAARWSVSDSYCMGMQITYGDDKGLPLVSYAHHGAFNDNDYIECFDNVFFNLTESGTRATYLESRVMFENGYEALNRAGYTKRTLIGQEIGVYVGSNLGCFDGHATSLTNALREDCSDPGVAEGLLLSLVSSGMVARFSHALNLTGSAVTVDTACSASLSAMAVADKELELDRSGTKYEALVGGVNVMSSLMVFAQFCFIGALGFKGRSFTFDEHVDGYMRGEGCCQAVLRRSNHQTQEADLALSLGTILAVISGSDGKSASLAAPSGPAQQKITRHSMQMAGITVDECPGNECHGTGTPLGDPIEMGTVKAVWRSSTYPVGVTSRKTYMGHTEANAGITGLCGCLIMLSRSIGLPNIHFREQSQLLDMTGGFMCQFMTECVEMKRDQACVGVCSFGIGGTNARADLWGRPGLDGGGLFEHTPNRLALRSLQFSPPGQDSVLQSHSMFSSDGYDQHGLSKRDYARVLGETDRNALLDSDIYASDRLYVLGSWDGYTIPLKMQASGDSCFTAVVKLGDVRCEQFYVMVAPEGIEVEAQAAQLPDTQPNSSKKDAQDDIPALLDVAGDDAGEGCEISDDYLDVISHLMDFGSERFECDLFDTFRLLDDCSLSLTSAESHENSHGMHLWIGLPNALPPGMTKWHASAKPYRIQNYHPPLEDDADLEMMYSCMLPSTSLTERGSAPTASVVQQSDRQPEASKDLQNEDTVESVLTTRRDKPIPRNATVSSSCDFGVFLFVQRDLLASAAEELHREAAVVADRFDRCNFFPSFTDREEIPQRTTYSSRDSRGGSSEKAPSQIRFIYPTGMASEANTYIRGPEVRREEGHGWLIDGRGSDTVFYSITLDITADRKLISWEPLEEDVFGTYVLYRYPFQNPFLHRYYIFGDFTRWRRIELRPNDIPHCYEVSFSLDTEGQAEFKLVRDGDLQQAIYPGVKPGDLFGPDAAGYNEQWRLSGDPLEKVVFILQVLKGKITVTARLSMTGSWIWVSA